jgi:hypothetical protein
MNLRSKLAEPISKEKILIKEIPIGTKPDLAHESHHGKSSVSLH